MAAGAHTFARGGRAFELQLGAELAGERVGPGQRVPRLALVPHEVAWKRPVNGWLAVTLLWPRAGAQPGDPRADRARTHARTRFRPLGDTLPRPLLAHRKAALN